MSSGVATIVQLLCSDTDTLELAPIERIGAGVLPQGTPLPFLSVELVSSIDRNLSSPGVKRRVQDRVQVTMAAATYEELATLASAVKRACADKSPEVDGLSDVIVHSLGAGPDFMNEMATIYLGSRDFRVWYNELR